MQMSPGGLIRALCFTHTLIRIICYETATTLEYTYARQTRTKQTSDKATDVLNRPTEERQDISSATAVHPVIAALEKADAPTVVIDGFLGTSKDAVVRLYHTLDTSAYVEIPREAVIHMAPHKNGEPGALRAFVRASSEILSVRRHRLRALDFVGQLSAVPQMEFPPLQHVDAPFYQCAAVMEETFKNEMDRINGNLTLPYSVRQFQRDIAEGQLRTGINECVARFGAPSRLLGGVEAHIDAILVRHPLI